MSVLSIRRSRKRVLAAFVVALGSVTLPVPVLGDETARVVAEDSGVRHERDLLERVDVERLMAGYADDPDGVLQELGEALYRGRLNGEAFQYALDQLWSIEVGERRRPTFDKHLQDAFYSASGGAARHGQAEELEAWLTTQRDAIPEDKRPLLNDWAFRLTTDVRANEFVQQVFDVLNSQGSLTEGQVDEYFASTDASLWGQRSTYMVRDVYADALYYTLKRNPDNESLRESARDKLLLLSHEPHLMTRSRQGFRKALMLAARPNDPAIAAALEREFVYERSLYESHPEITGDERERFLDRRDSHLTRLEDAAELLDKGSEARRDAEWIEQRMRSGEATSEDVDRMIELAGRDYGRSVVNEMMQASVSLAVEHLLADPKTHADILERVYDWSGGGDPKGDPRAALWIVVRIGESESVSIEELGKSISKIGSDDEREGESDRRRDAGSHEAEKRFEWLSDLYGSCIGERDLEGLVQRSVAAELAESAIAVCGVSRRPDDDETTPRERAQCKSIHEWAERMTNDPPCSRFAASPYEMMASAAPSRSLDRWLEQALAGAKSRRVRVAIERARSRIEEGKRERGGVRAIQFGDGGRVAMLGPDTPD